MATRRGVHLARRRERHPRKGRQHRERHQRDYQLSMGHSHESTQPSHRDLGFARGEATCETEVAGDGARFGPTSRCDSHLLRVDSVCAFESRFPGPGGCVRESLEVSTCHNRGSGGGEYIDDSVAAAASVLGLPRECREGRGLRGSRPPLVHPYLLRIDATRLHAPPSSPCGPRTSKNTTTNPRQEICEIGWEPTVASRSNMNHAIHFRCPACACARSTAERCCCP
jgi:hypothetical protein